MEKKILKNYWINKNNKKKLNGQFVKMDFPKYHNRKLQNINKVGIYTRKEVFKQQSGIRKKKKSYISLKKIKFISRYFFQKITNKNVTKWLKKWIAQFKHQKFIFKYPFYRLLKQQKKISKLWLGIKFNITKESSVSIIKNLYTWKSYKLNPWILKNNSQISKSYLYYTKHGNLNSLVLDFICKVSHNIKIWEKIISINAIFEIYSIWHKQNQKIEKNVQLIRYAFYRYNKLQILFWKNKIHKKFLFPKKKISKKTKKVETKLIFRLNQIFNKKKYFRIYQRLSRQIIFFVSLNRKKKVIFPRIYYSSFKQINYFGYLQYLILYKKKYSKRRKLRLFFKKILKFELLIYKKQNLLGPLLKKRLKYSILKKYQNQRFAKIPVQYDNGHKNYQRYNKKQIEYNSNQPQKNYQHQKYTKQVDYFINKKNYQNQKYNKKQKKCNHHQLQHFTNKQNYKNNNQSFINKQKNYQNQLQYSINQQKNYQNQVKSSKQLGIENIKWQKKNRNQLDYTFNNYPKIKIGLTTQLYKKKMKLKPLTHQSYKQKKIFKINEISNLNKIFKDISKLQLKNIKVQLSQFKKISKFFSKKYIFARIRQINKKKKMDAHILALEIAWRSRKSYIPLKKQKNKKKKKIITLWQNAELIARIKRKYKLRIFILKRNIQILKKIQNKQFTVHKKKFLQNLLEQLTRLILIFQYKLKSLLVWAHKTHLGNTLVLQAFGEKEWEVGLSSQYIRWQIKEPYIASSLESNNEIVDNFKNNFSKFVRRVKKKKFFKHKKQHYFFYQSQKSKYTPNVWKFYKIWQRKFFIVDKSLQKPSYRKKKFKKIIFKITRLFRKLNIIGKIFNLKKKKILQVKNLFLINRSMKKKINPHLLNKIVCSNSSYRFNNKILKKKLKLNYSHRAKLSSNKNRWKFYFFRRRDAIFKIFIELKNANFFKKFNLYNPFTLFLIARPYCTFNFILSSKNIRILRHNLRKKGFPVSSINILFTAIPSISSQLYFYFFKSLRSRNKILSIISSNQISRYNRRHLYNFIFFSYIIGRYFFYRQQRVKVKYKPTRRSATTQDFVINNINTFYWISGSTRHYIPERPQPNKRGLINLRKIKFWQLLNRFNTFKKECYFSRQLRRYRPDLVYYRTKKGIFKVKLLFKHIFKWLYNYKDVFHHLGSRIRRTIFQNYKVNTNFLYSKQLKIKLLTNENVFSGI